VGDTEAEILEALAPLDSGGLRSVNGTHLSHQGEAVLRMATVSELEDHQQMLLLHLQLEAVEVIMERESKEHQSHGQAGAPVSAA